MHVAAQRQRNGGGSKQELDQGGVPGYQAPQMAQSLQGIGKWPARIRDGRGEFGKAENERKVEYRNDQSGNEQPHRSGDPQP